MTSIPEEFRVIVSSDQDYEQLIAEIYFGDRFVGIVSQEKGLEELALEIRGSDFDPKRNLPLRPFLKALERAMERLQELKLHPERSRIKPISG